MPSNILRVSAASCRSLVLSSPTEKFNFPLSLFISLLLVECVKQFFHPRFIPRVINLDYLLLALFGFAVLWFVRRNDRSVHNRIGVRHFIKDIVEREIVGLGDTCDYRPNAVV